MDPTFPPPRIVGIDDWAIAKGHCYEPSQKMTRKAPWAVGHSWYSGSTIPWSAR
ncbi:hypothetical protein [Sulfobacillus sp. hq2]|uniref:hypothetical protein n=1 Tax=Sulfobacillus TaxID=28033 RepID=UPI001304D444|nr:hypothetical protein [Sulfobacillus sp. hq2]